jgi:hypothetical protein
MKLKFILILAAVCATVIFSNAQPLEKEVKHFTRIITSPKINVILRKGDTEKVVVEYNEIAKGKINVEVTGKTLHIYLDGARKIEKQVNYHGHRGYQSVYDGAHVTAYITYKNLEELEIRGEQEVTCNDPIESEEFILRAYGVNHITLASLRAAYFKVAMYGENKLLIKDGKVTEQRYKLYGENDINTLDMKSAYITTSIFGEGDLRVHSAKEVNISAFGEPTVTVNGAARVRKKMVFGHARVYRN